MLREYLKESVKICPAKCRIYDVKEAIAVQSILAAHACRTCLTCPTRRTGEGLADSSLYGFLYGHRRGIAGTVDEQ